MFYCMNPKFKYQFFSPQSYDDPIIDPIPVPADDEPAVPIDNNEPSKRNLVGALKALYVAYGGKEELNNNAVDIIYKIAEVINEKK